MRISIVIPTLNEAERIDDLIAATRRLGACEVIVVDGGSDDETLARAAKAGRCLIAPRGRASQQNAGTAAATGEVLLFLHADCRLEPGALEEVREVLNDRRVVAGFFRQRIDADGFIYRLLERGNLLRARLFGRVYGDQGLFVRREVFEQFGGFPDVPILEDAIFSKRLRQAGRIRAANGVLHVSARRWQRVGVVRQTLLNWRILLCARCGVSLDRLAGWYRQGR